MAAPETNPERAPEQLNMDGTDSSFASVSAPRGAPSNDVEFATGPHVRVSVAAIFFTLWYVSERVSLVPFILFWTASTSALWCTCYDVVLSLGPVPVCLFRKRIPYERICDIAVINSRLSACCILARRLACIWQPEGFMYGSALGKCHIDIVLRIEGGGMANLFQAQRLLVSVCDPDAMTACVTFRKQNGPRARNSFKFHPPGSFLTSTLCDACRVLAEPWHSAAALPDAENGRRR